ncbi:MAG: HEAT repeat domain-containing protein [Thermodesulfovibrio sp.]|nr:HEAT repeat domain-containing protein [Thermodesulfovibrio sp.]
MPFEEKLIYALKHPVREIRKTAIFIIGLKKMRSAIKELEKILIYEEDSIMIIEILNSLKNIGTEEAMEIIERFKFHSSSLISSYINKFLVHKPINDNN